MTSQKEVVCEVTKTGYLILGFFAVVGDFGVLLLFASSDELVKKEIFA